MNAPRLLRGLYWRLFKPEEDIAIKIVAKYFTDKAWNYVEEKRRPDSILKQIEANWTEYGFFSPEEAHWYAITAAMNSDRHVLLTTADPQRVLERYPLDRHRKIYGVGYHPPPWEEVGKKSGKS